METASIVDTEAAVRRTPRWVLWLQFAAIAALVGRLYISIIPDLAAEWWTEPASSYGMLIPPLAAYIAYLRRSSTLALPVSPETRGLWLIAAACLVFLVGNLAAEFFLARISFVLMLAGLTWTFWGCARFRTLLFPFVLLVTMVPLPAVIYNQVAAPLQLFASSAAARLAQFLGVSIYQDGNIIHLAGMTLGVAEACSGLQSLSAMVVASLLLGFLENTRMVGRILLVIASIPLAIAVNVLRVAGTAVLADHEQEFAMGFYHLFSGWLVFLMGFALLWLVSKILIRWMPVKR